MHTGTGEIRNFTDKEILELPTNERKNWVKLTYDQEQALSGLNRKQRREYYKKHKKEFEGLTWADLTKAAKVGVNV